ncbi:hypothetical protein VTK26DRAFT_7798 [Humicola hyalothermophila]
MESPDLASVIPALTCAKLGVQHLIGPVSTIGGFQEPATVRPSPQPVSPTDTKLIAGEDSASGEGHHEPQSPQVLSTSPPLKETRHTVGRVYSGLIGRSAAALARISSSHIL